MDVADTNWAKDEIFFCYSKEILFKEYRYFYPNSGLTRAEAVKGIADALELDIPTYATTPFTDVPSTSQYSGSIKWAYDNDISHGTGNGQFSPNSIITRQEFATLLYRSCLVENINLPVITNNVTFNDRSSIASWALPAVTALAKSHIIIGYTNGNFGPTNTIDRASAACVLYKFYSIANYDGQKILLFIRSSYGSPISNAATYVYHYNTDTRYDKYPEQAVYSNSEGIVYIPSTNTYPYAVNVFANGYRQGISDDFLERDYFMKTIILTSDNNSQYAVPVSGFTSTSFWTSTRNYLNSCQNFGWRYGTDSQYEFHQGIDIPKSLGTPVYSSSPGQVTLSVELPAYGNIIQVQTEFADESRSYFFVYQHLNTRLVYTNDPVVRSEKIGTVGNTGGTYGYHLHYSISTTSAIDLESRAYMDPFAFLTNNNPYYS